MKLFARTYKAASSLGFALVLYTEKDMLVEISRVKTLKQRDWATRLEQFLEHSSKIGDQLENNTSIFMLVDLNHREPQLLYFSNLSEVFLIEHYPELDELFKLLDSETARR